ELLLEEAEAHYRGQTARLSSPSRLSFADGLAIHGLKVGVQHALIELDGRLAPVLEARASVHHLDAELVSTFAPDLLSQGSLDVDARLRGTISAPTGEVHATASEVRFAN